MKTIAKFELNIIGDQDGDHSAEVKINFSKPSRVDIALLYFELRNQLRRLESRIDEIEEPGRSSGMNGSRLN